MQILSDILPYNNAKRPAYKWRVFFLDGLHKTYKVFKVKAEAVDFIKQAKKWNNTNAAETPIANINEPNNAPSIVPLAKSAISRYQAIERICAEYKTTIEGMLSFFVEHNQKKCSTIKIKDAVKKYIEKLESSDLSISHKRHCYHTLNRFSKGIENRFLSTLDTAFIQKWLDGLKVLKTQKQAKLVETPTPISNVSYNNYRLHLLVWLNWCIKQGFIEKNPVQAIEKKKTHKEDICFYTVDQCKEWLESATDVDTRFYIALALFTGIRKAELLRLKYENIYIQDKEIVLSAGITKTLQRRIVKIPDNLVKYVEDMNIANASGLVFPQGLNAIECRIKRLAKKLSFPTIQNGFRHSAASYYLAKTGNEYETARQLGHSVEILKRHYAGLVRASEADKFYQL